MARVDSQTGFQPSIVDRLIDADSGGTAWRRGYGATDMMAVVRRDLEDLLNTHCSHHDVPEDFIEVRHSIIGYGLPDLVSMNALSPEQREEIGRVLEAIVTRFEPRLRDVRATLLDPNESKDRKIRFRID